MSFLFFLYYFREQTHLHCGKYTGICGREWVFILLFLLIVALSWFLMLNFNLVLYVLLKSHQVCL